MPEFRSLAQMLAPPNEVEIASPQTDLPAPPSVVPKEDGADLREVRLFHAHLAETLERTVHDLLRAIAHEILARELILAPVDIKALLEINLERYRHLQPLRVRAHSEDVADLGNCGVPVFADDEFGRGDVCIELKNGSLDLTLAARMDALLGSVNEA